MKEKKQGSKHDSKSYTVEVKYSAESKAKKLVRFTAKENGVFEISTDELIDIVAMHVNSQLLAPMFVETDSINIVQVQRQISAIADRNISVGEKINLNYFHPYPLEFALIEQAYKIAKVDEGIEVKVLTKKFIEEVKNKIKPEMEDFIKNFYKSYKHLSLEK